MTASRREIVDLWQRAQEALRATGTLLTAGFPDFAAARAYYAAFYAASALLLTEGKTFRSHRGVMALMHRDYVRPGRLPMSIGRMLSTLSDLRSIGDWLILDSRVVEFEDGVHGTGSVRWERFCL